MNIAPRKSMTLREFPAWESRQELRYEFDGFQPVAMNGVSSEHAFIESSLKAVLRDRLKGKPCRAFGSGLRIEVAGRIRYPDVFVSALLCRAAPTLSVTPWSCSRSSLQSMTKTNLHNRT